MIDKALSFLREQANDYVKSKVSGSGERVILTHVVNEKGEVIIPAEEVGMTLVNVEEERINKDQKYFTKAPDGTVTRINPELHLNLYILFAVNSAVYETGLILLSNIIGFFQNKPTFNHQNSPTLDTKIEKLILDLYSFPIEQQHYLWSSLGGKYLPSVVYKVRLVTVQNSDANEVGPPIFTVDAQLHQS